MKHLSFFGLCCGLLLSGALSAAVESPYGVCAHISRGEFSVAPQELELMRSNGIGWVRSDFDWKTVEPKQGQWDYSRIDAVVELAGKYQIKILPILDYDVPWATPAYKNLDTWLNYVTNTVTRYKDILRFWEVWNEENLAGMWREQPDAGNYCKLIKATYQAIKKIDPELKVVLGGTAGIPAEFIEKFLQSGGGAYCDIINIHPYRYPDTPEAVSIYHDVLALKKLLKKYNVDKVIWITEIGWPTHRGSDDVAGIVKNGLKALGCASGKLHIAAVVDPAWGYGENNFFNFIRSYFPPDAQLDKISVAGIAGLSPEKYPVLMLPSEEGFPMEHFTALENYVVKGGIVIFSKGVPLYYNLKKNADGSIVKEKVGEEFRKRLHIGWEAWWTKKGLPAQTNKVEVSEDFRAKLKLADLPCETFFTGEALQGGDKMIPVVYGIDSKYKGCAVAAYKFNSNLKGGVLAISFRAIGGGVTDLAQAEMLPRAFLLAFQSGVEKIFWYELQSPGGPLYDRESHFGLLQRDLSRKSGFDAYSTLTAMRPAGSAGQMIMHNAKNIYLASWERPDGVKVWAVWSVMEPVDCVLNIDGSIIKSVDFLGRNRKVSLNDGKLALKAEAGILYLVGPKQVSLDNSVEME